MRAARIDFLPGRVTSIKLAASYFPQLVQRASSFAPIFQLSLNLITSSPIFERSSEAESPRLLSSVVSSPFRPRAQWHRPRPFHPQGGRLLEDFPEAVSCFFMVSSQTKKSSPKKTTVRFRSVSFQGLGPLLHSFADAMHRESPVPMCKNFPHPDLQASRTGNCGPSCPFFTDRNRDRVSWHTSQCAFLQYPPPKTIFSRPKGSLCLLNNTCECCCVCYSQIHEDLPVQGTMSALLPSPSMKRLYRNIIASRTHADPCDPRRAKIPLYFVYDHGCTVSKEPVPLSL